MQSEAVQQLLSRLALQSTDPSDVIVVQDKGPSFDPILVGAAPILLIVAVVAIALWAGRSRRT